VQAELDFPGTVYGLPRGTPMPTIMARQSEFYSAHRDDQIIRSLTIAGAPPASISFEQGLEQCKVLPIGSLHGCRHEGRGKTCETGWSSAVTKGSCACAGQEGLSRYTSSPSGMSLRP
jgi:hypothetical protein